MIALSDTKNTKFAVETGSGINLTRKLWFSMLCLPFLNTHFGLNRKQKIFNQGSIGFFLIKCDIPLVSYDREC